MFCGLALQDLVIGLAVGNVALSVILLTILYSLSHFMIFSVLPILQLVFGAMLLINPEITVKVLLSMPLLGSFAELDKKSLVLLGFIFMSAAWSNYFIGHATKPLVKIFHSGLITITSYVLFTLSADHDGQCIQIFKMKCDSTMLGVYVIGFCGLVVTLGNLVVGPAAMKWLDNMKHHRKCP